LLSVCLLSLPLRAQLPPDPSLQRMQHPDEFHTENIYETDQGTTLVIVHVFAEKNGIGLDRPSRLELRNLTDGSGVYEMVGGHDDGIFNNVVYGKYDLAVSAVGYLTAHQEIQVVYTRLPAEIDIVLHRDPSAINLGDVTGAMPRDARKEARHGVALLKADQLEQAQAHLEKAYKSAPLNADVNFLLGYLYFQKKDYARAESYLATAESLSPHSGHTLTLLGRADLAQDNYPAAISALQQAIVVDEEDWLPHHFLADAYLHQKEYAKSCDEAHLAIAKGEKFGKNTAGPAELVLGQALMALGRKDEAIQALGAFVKESPDDPMIYQVRPLIAELQKPAFVAVPEQSSTRSRVEIVRGDPLESQPEPRLTTQAWRPPDIDDIKPDLTPGIACPGPQVLAESGKRVQEMVQDLARFTADEELLHKSIDAFGFSGREETRKYNYVAVVSPEPGQVSIEEYRSDKIAQEGDPDAIGSTGFVLLALVFHPDMQSDFDFQCEGQSEWHGKATWLVHFRQRPDRLNRMLSYRLGSEVFPVDLKGRAWITADKFQIVRIEADMVRPMREIQLLSEHQIVDYGPVPFAKKKTMLWLPKNVEIYFDFRKHHYYRRHSFDHYMLFSVDTEEKPKVPPSSPASGGPDEKSPS
jgi:tetratricopeptide (TPR) repeat protein